MLLRSHSTCWPSRAIRLSLLVFTLVGWGCDRYAGDSVQRLRLATTTSTRDSGLLEQLLPPFEAEQQTKVDVIAVGTGKALKLGEVGDVDVLLVHAREAEEEFMAAGHGTRREVVMVNSFELLGPPDDPAEVRGLQVSAALKKIAASGSKFLSRGDDSGTHKRELQLWAMGGERPTWPEYLESGQGMGATLTIADEKSAYVLTDRGTFLHFRDKIDLRPLLSESDAMRNPYGVIAVNADKHAALRGRLASAFIDYLISPTAQQIIANYRVAGEPLFTPLQLPPTP